MPQVPPYLVASLVVTVSLEKIMRFRSIQLSFLPFLFVSQLMVLGISSLPRLTFALVNESGEAELDIVRSDLLVCADEACTTSTPLEVGGPQGLFCHQMSCRASTYGRFRPYNKIALTFADGSVRTSSPFFTVGLHETPYQLRVFDDRLEASLDVTALRPAMIFHPITNWLILLGTLLLLTLYSVYSVGRFLKNRLKQTRESYG